MYRRAVIGCVILVLFLFFNGNVLAEIDIGVQAPRSHTKAIKKWASMADYLTVEIGQKVHVVPLHPAETLEAVRAGKVDYMLSNPVLALILKHRSGAEYLVTMKTRAGSHFSGVIISKKGSGITRSEDLRDKFVLSYKFRRSAAAYVFQVKHLNDKGIDPHNDFDVFREVRSTQDVIVQAVNRGLVDAGFIKSGLLEEMQREGKLKIDDFEIVDRAGDQFPHVHSTKLYPEWTMTSLEKSEKSVSEAIRKALIKLSPDHPVCRSAKIAGFVPPVNFNDLETALKTLKLPPYE